MIVESLHSETLSSLARKITRYLNEFKNYDIEISDPRKEKNKWIVSFVRRK
jgi:hypothetical protein